MITASIVLYKNDKNQVSKAVDSLLRFEKLNYLFLVDNSPTNILSVDFTSLQIIYSHSPDNPGFGASHNKAIEQALKLDSKCHFIVNPDIWFDLDIMTPMIDYISNNDKIGMVMPKVLNIDGTIQHLPKILPTPMDMVYRKIKFPRSLYNRFIENYELRSYTDSAPINVPILSGCFTLLNLNLIKEMGFYDDEFFMYFEDWDLSRRIHEKYQTIYLPQVAIYHEYKSEANINPKLFLIFINSFVHYFNKWGWFFDKKRKSTNRNVILQLKK
jgi:GT2 family glycosyltransferase